MKNLTASWMFLAVSLGLASASFAETEVPDDPVGCLSSGCEEPDDPKGNNGWGNGIDGDNPGTDAGPPSQVETKNNREIWDKFDGKFEGR